MKVPILAVNINIQETRIRNRNANFARFDLLLIVEVVRPIPMKAASTSCTQRRPHTT